MSAVINWYSITILSLIPLGHSRFEKQARPQFIFQRKIQGAIAFTAGLDSIYPTIVPSSVGVGSGKGWTL